MSDVVHQQTLTSPNNNQNNNQKVVVLDYASLRNLGCKNVTENNEQNIKLLPGLGIRTKKSFMRKNDFEEETMIPEPNLLTTAKRHMKQSYGEQDNISQAQLSNFLGLTSHLVSRQVTPGNPLMGGIYRKKILPSHKNKMNSIGSELFDIQSNPQSNIQKTHVKIRLKEFRLYDHILGQSELVYKHVFKKQKNINYKIVTAWKDCLSHEDKAEVYVSVDEQKKVQIPYTHSRIYQINQIEKGFKEIYGHGKNRSLTIGQESMIIQQIERYLKICSKDPLKIGRKDFDIIETIINDCNMSDMQNFPMCMKQIQTIFKLMATKWKYSGNLDHHDKIVQSALIMGKNNFLQLTKKNILTEFLLKNSNIHEL